VASVVTSWSSEPQSVGDTPWIFPDPSDWPDEDVVAAGADLAPATIIAAYRQGLFPMNVEGPPRRLGWWSPNPRGILPLDGMRITKSLRQSAKRFQIRVDTCFTQVIRGCAEPVRGGVWITPKFVNAFIALHQLGWAHSIEVFSQEGELAGGLYGVRVGGLFAGESMFHRQRDASKVALMALVNLMRDSGMTLLDVQWRTDHLASLGAIEISRDEYLNRLKTAVG
jgi:leucyl/phenylalanyl-tRNA---protein transferase